jgi:hypothetical protein
LPAINRNWKNQVNQRKWLIMKEILFVMAFTAAFVQAHSQAWTPVTSPRGNFSFTLPTSSTPTDTLKLLSYSYIFPSDSTIYVEIHYMDSAAISASPDLQSLMDSTGTAPNSDTIALMLNLYANMYGKLTSGTVEGYDSVTYSSNIKGRELTIRRPDLLNSTSNYYFDFTRYYYYHGRFLSFTVSGPEAKLTNLYSYKNQLFGSIALSW